MPRLWLSSLLAVKGAFNERHCTACCRAFHWLTFCLHNHNTSVYSPMDFLQMATTSPIVASLLKASIIAWVILPSSSNIFSRFASAKPCFRLWAKNRNWIGGFFLFYMLIYSNNYLLSSVYSPLLSGGRKPLSNAWI